MTKSLMQMELEVRQNNVEKGWFDTDRSFGDGIALAHSELSEALDYYRKIGMESRTEADGKPTDVASEFADVFIRLLDMCARHGVALEDEYERKMAYNRTRPYRHGDQKL
jgi:NTP pyrophosphatase (non-canonical NTP hydrolase)